MRDSNPCPRPTAETVCSWSGYLYFVFEREAIRIARLNDYKGALTEDPVLAKYRFTNIRRRDDRMTKWFITHLIEPAVDAGDSYLWFTLLVARLINWPPTLNALLNAHVIPCRPYEFDAEEFVKVLEGQKGKGVQVYGGAYLVYPTMKEPGGVKSHAMAKWIIGDAIKRVEDINFALWGADMGEPSIERFVAALSQCFGISTFIAGQVAADLSYTPNGCNFRDVYTWAPLGPGSQKGLNYLFGKKLNHTWAQKDFNDALIEANGLINDQLDITDLTLHDVQNTMCEFSKYARTVLGEGKPKSVYKPEGAY